MRRYIEYGNCTIGYEIDSDVNGNKAIIVSVDGLGVDLDQTTLNDIQFRCQEDFTERQYKHYMATGETL